MAALIEAIEIKRKMFFEYEGAPYHTIDVEVSRPTARGGQTLVRIKMRNLLTQAVFDKISNWSTRCSSTPTAPVITSWTRRATTR
jgi:translation elongation factor P/translation initiation factor 5A